MIMTFIRGRGQNFLLLLPPLVMLLLIGCVSQPDSSSQPATGKPVIVTAESEESLQPFLTALSERFPGVEWEIRPPEDLTSVMDDANVYFAVAMISADSAARFDTNEVDASEEWKRSGSQIQDRGMVSATTMTRSSRSGFALHVVAYDAIQADHESYAMVAEAIRDAAEQHSDQHDLAAAWTPGPDPEQAAYDRVPEWLVEGEEIFFTLEDNILIVYSTVGRGELPLAEIHMEEITNDEGRPGFRLAADDLSDGLMLGFFVSVVDLDPIDRSGPNQWVWAYGDVSNDATPTLEIFRQGLDASRMRIRPGSVFFERQGAPPLEMQSETRSAGLYGSSYVPAWAAVHRNRQPPEQWFADDRVSNIYLENGRIYAVHLTTGDEQTLATMESRWRATRSDGSRGELTVTLREHPGLGIVGGYFSFSTDGARWLDPTHPRGGGNIVTDTYRFDRDGQPGTDTVGRDGEVSVLARSADDRNQPVSFRNRSMSIRFADGTVRQFDLGGGPLEQ